LQGNLGMKKMVFEYLSFLLKEFCIVQVKGMITDFGDDMHCQFLEILRILLDSCTLSGAQVQLYVLSLISQSWLALLLIFT
jgi:hypothetical protein